MTQIAVAGADTFISVYSLPRSSSTTDADADKADHGPPLLPPTHELRGHNAGCFGVAFGPRSLLGGVSNTSILASCSSDKTVLLWQFSADSASLSPNICEPVAKFTHDSWIEGLDFSLDGKIAAGGGDASNIFVWDAETNQQLFFIAEHQSPVRSCIFTTDGRLLLSGASDSHVKAFDMRAPSDNNVVIDVKMHHPVSTMALTSDDTTVAVGTDNCDNHWDNDTVAVEVLPLCAPSLRCCSFSPHRSKEPARLRFSKDTRRLLTCSRDNSAVVWSIKDDLDDGSASWRAEPKMLSKMSAEDNVHDFQFVGEKEEMLAVASKGAVDVFSTEAERLFQLDYPESSAVWGLASQTV